ncbi:hypothetical protein A3N69_21835 [Klebsiella aerogenes]|nr:hypothetical protein A3N69_21835 [Klebsiella aerogenes]
MIRKASHGITDPLNDFTSISRRFSPIEKLILFFIHQINQIITIAKCSHFKSKSAIGPSFEAT